VVTSVNDSQESQALVDQALSEINANLIGFRRAFQVESLWMGGLTISVALGIPALGLQAWLLGTGSPLRAVLAGVVLAVVGFTVSFGWRVKRNRLFNATRTAALRLQRAGFQLYKKEKFLNSIVEATRGPLQDGMEIIDFTTVSAYELDAIMA